MLQRDEARLRGVGKNTRGPRVDVLATRGKAAKSGSGEPPLPMFLTVVCVLRNQESQLEALVGNLIATVAPLVSDYELVIVDNASEDQSVAALRNLAGEDGIANLQVYVLTKEVDLDTASWVGVENALGDHVAIVDPLADDIQVLPRMLDRLALGVDVVFATNERRAAQGVLYRAAFATFNRVYRLCNGIDLGRDAPHFRLLSKRVVNFILQHAQPAVAYRHLPASAGFARMNLTYSSTPQGSRPRSLFDSLDRGTRLLVSTTRAPMRLVTSLSLFGALVNVLYSIYVVAVALFKQNVAPGWVSLSLQQSGMFFLLSLVLLVLGEYVLNMASLSNEGPLYHVAQEFTSARMIRRERLNVESPASTQSNGLDQAVNVEPLPFKQGNGAHQGVSGAAG